MKNKIVTAINKQYSLANKKLCLLLTNLFFNIKKLPNND